MHSQIVPRLSLLKPHKVCRLLATLKGQYNYTVASETHRDIYSANIFLNSHKLVQTYCFCFIFLELKYILPQ